MQVLKEEIRANIIKAAKELFLKKGFETASMNMIAKKAGISKSNLYNYFFSKEEIFNQLTEAASVQIENALDGLFRHHECEDFDLEAFISMASEKLLVILTKYREEILLIVDCSKGTPLENFKHEIIFRIQNHYILELKELNLTTEDNFSFFAHYVATSWVEGLLEIIRHNKTDLWIKNNINMFIGYHIRAYSHFFDEYK